MNIRHAICALGSLIIAYMPLIAEAEMVGLEEKELSEVSGQSGLSVEIPHLRINAYDSGSVDNPNTPVDESDGRRDRGFKLDYVTREHSGGNESHYFVEEVSLAVDITGALTFDIEGDGALVIGLPDSINYVGDGYSQKGIYINDTGTIDGGGMMLNEISIQGNFDTGGTITIWGN